MTTMIRAICVVLGIQVGLVSSVLIVPSSARGLAVVLGFISIGALLIASAKHQKAFEEQLAEETRELRDLMSHYEQQAMTDALTSLLNRRGGEDAIAHHIARCRRLKTAFSFILIDIDHFKQINDRYGHAVGDMVISGVTQAIRENLRAADFAIRWGGEEFLACLPDTDLEGAIITAEKLRAVIEKLDFDITPVTASFGCAELGEDPPHLAIARADMHLYFAKSKGRNRVFPKTLQKMLDVV